MKKLFLLIALLACVPAMADSWDSNQNIDKAMTAALKTYASNGVSGMVDQVNNCNAGLDTRPGNKNLGRDVEYCIAYEMSAAIIDREAAKDGNFPRSGAFDGNKVMVRAMLLLEKARIVRLPEEFERYLLPRFTKIDTELPLKM